MRLAKKLGIGLGVLLALLVLAAAIVPFVVDVDKYRPEIERIANQSLNGRLSIGKLSLSLWGQLKVDIAGIEVRDASDQKLLAVKDANLSMPLVSLLLGAPRVTLRLSRPEVSAVKSSGGEWNWLTLLKPAPASATPPPAATPSPSIALPALLSRARLDLECRGAELVVTDRSQGQVKITELDVLIRDLSLQRQSTFSLAMQLGATLPDSRVKGPIRIDGSLLPRVVGGQFLGGKASASVDLTELQVGVPGMFEKPRSMPWVATLEAEMSPDAVQVPKFAFQFHTLQIQGRGKLTRKETPTAEFSMASGSVDLADFASLFPGLRGAKFSGQARFEASVQGPLSKLGYSADFELKKFRLEGGLAKQPVVIDASAKVVTDRIEKFEIVVSSAGQDLHLDGRVQSLLKPQVDIRLTSRSFDLDAMFDLPASSGSAGPSVAKASAPQANSAPTQDVDRDALLAPLQSNAMARATTVQAVADLAKVKAYGVVIAPLRAKAQLAGLRGTISQAEVGVFGGRVSAQGSFDLSARVPTYHFKTDVRGLDLGAAARSQLSMFKNTLTGTVQASCKGSGASFNTSRAKGSLSLQGSFRAQDAVFSTIDIGKMVGDGLNAALERASAQVPVLKNARLQSVPSGKAEYEQVSANFTVEKGEFHMPNFATKARPGQGIDLEGRTRLNLLSDSIEAQWLVIDRNNITKAKDISVQVEGVEVPHVLARGDGPFSFPVTVGCKLTSPCYSYGELPAHLAKVALENLGQAATRKAKQELETRGKQFLQDQLQKGLEGLFKR